MDRLAELKNGVVDMVDVEHKETDEETSRKEFTKYIDCIMMLITELNSINKTIKLKTINRRYDIANIIKHTKSLHEQIIHLIKIIEQNYCSVGYHRRHLKLCKDKLIQVYSENTNLIEDNFKQYTKEVIFDNVPKQQMLSSRIDLESQTVNDRHQDILTLEANVQELRSMFMDFAIIIERNGEILDNVETDIKEAADKIDEGNKDIVDSIELQKQICYKRICCSLLIVAVIVIIIVVLCLMLQR